MERKLDVGGTLSQAFSIYGSQAGVLLPLAFAIFLAVAILAGLLSAISWVLLPIVFALSVIGNTLYQGMVVSLVSDVQDGRRDSSVGDLVNSAAPVILPLFLAGLLAGLGIALGFVLLIVPGLILLTIWSVIAPVIVLERTGVIEAFGRSRELVRGHGWQVFGVIVCVFLIIVVARTVLGAIAVGIDDSVVMRTLFDVIGSTLTAPVVALVASVLYFRLKSIKDGGAAAPADPGPAVV
jgi:Uncharacterised protein family (UPF0259)